MSTTVTANHNIVIADVQNLSNVLATKAIASVVNSQISTVNNNISTKANSSDLTSQINTVNNNLATKQNVLIRNASAQGSPVIDPSNNIRCIFGVSPIDVSLYFDPLVPADPRQNQIQVSVDLADYATLSYVATAIANLVNSSPAELNTLAELATALGNDANFSTTINKLNSYKANKDNHILKSNII